MYVCVPVALDVREMVENLPKLRGTQAQTSLLKNSRHPITEGHKSDITKQEALIRVWFLYLYNSLLSFLSLFHLSLHQCFVFISINPTLAAFTVSLKEMS